MSPNLDMQEKRSPEYFDNPGFINNELDCAKPGKSFEIETQISPMSSHRSSTVQPKIKIRKSTQILSALAANFGAFALGAVLAWSATALPSMRESESIGDISKSEEAWIGSIVALGAAVACPVASYAMVSYGRRLSMLLLTAPFVGGWLLIAFAEYVPYPIYTIYFGRVLTGFCGGAFTIISPVFIAECAHVKIRGGLGAGFDLMLSVGMLYIYIVGTYTSWQTQALACGIIPIACHILLMLVPESPRYLVEQGKMDEASKALAWLYGLKEEEVANELQTLTHSVVESQAKPVNFRKVVMKLSVLKPILICVAILFFYTMSAIDAIIFYAVDIFKSTGSSLDPKESTMILGAVQVIATIPAAFVVDKCGRRLLLMISQVFMCLSLVAMGLFFFLTGEDDAELDLHKQLGWLPLTALNVFLIAYSAGIGPLALAMMGELLPSHIKGMTSCFVLMVRWILGFGVTNLFETLEDDIGIDKTYWIFATICGIGVIFVFFCVPETKGKTLDEIQIYFISPENRLRLSLTPLSRAYSGHSSMGGLSITNNIKV